MEASSRNKILLGAALLLLAVMLLRWFSFDRHADITYMVEDDQEVVVRATLPKQSVDEEELEFTMEEEENDSKKNSTWDENDGDIGSDDTFSDSSLPAIDEEMEEKEMQMIDEAVGKGEKRMSERIADNKLARMRARLGDGRGPFIVGGIGDSGTRGVHDVMLMLGVFMQTAGHVVWTSKDSKVFMAPRWETMSSGKRVVRYPSALYNEPIKNARSLNYNQSVVRTERWQLGRQWIADMMTSQINVTEKIRSRHHFRITPKDLLYPFGFKHPRTALLLPYWLDTLGEQFAFVHVIRDGREVSHGDNQRLFMDHAEPYYGKYNYKQKKPIEMWADLNRDIFQFVLQSKMKANQYFALRVEDIVLGDSRCFENLIKFLNLDSKTVESKAFKENLARAIETSHAHKRSYFGLKFKPSDRMQLLKVDSTAASDQLKFWGYATDSMSLEKDCTDLPWMRELRNAKGALPIDE